MPPKISGELTIRNAGEWKKWLCESLAGQHDLAVDCSEVEECDAAGIQLICSLLTRGDVRVCAFSAAVREAAADLGVSFEPGGEAPSGGV